MTSSPPARAAVHGANFLNAARNNFRHSSPPRRAPKTGNGKLPKAGRFTEPRKPLRRFGNSDWEVPEGSPEKGLFTLPEIVNQKPLKILKKNKVAPTSAVHSDAVVPSSDLPEPSQQEEGDDGDQQQPSQQDSPVRSFPPQLHSALNRADNDDEPGESESDPGDVQIPNERYTRCSAVTYKEGKGYEQCQRPKPETGGKGRCLKHATVELAQDHELLEAENRRQRRSQLPATARATRSTARKSVDNDSSSRASAKRKSIEDLDSHVRATKARRGQKHTSPSQEAEEVSSLAALKRERPKKSTVNSNPQVQIPARRSGSAGVAASTTRKHPQELVTDSIEEAEPTQSTNGIRKQHSAKSGKETVAPFKGRPKSTHGAKPVSSPRHESEGDEDGDGEPSTAKYPLGTMERVFEFLDRDDREGACQTELGTAINRVCVNTSSHLDTNDVAIEEVADNIEDVREVLKQVGELGKDGEKVRKALKKDMFGYVFRSLAIVLQSLYEGLRDMDENFMNSSRYMRIITPLMRDILDLKQTIKSWKVKTIQRYQGDRMIGDVGQHFIVPLREVYNIYHRHLSQLESREELRRQAEHMRRTNEERIEEDTRQFEAKRIMNKRYKRWQDLHMTRLETEPDLNMRLPKLGIIDFRNFEENDSNGSPMRRLEVFVERVNPPPSSFLKEVGKAKWSKEEEVTLLEGLEDYAGRLCCVAKMMLLLTRWLGPEVFHRIFRAHCGETGVLRKFTVTQIIARAMKMIRGARKLQQQEGSAIPIWVEQIPLLP